MVSTLAGLNLFSRIGFTSDLMLTDITERTSRRTSDGSAITISEGPLFSNVVLRRNQPHAMKTQAALLERCGAEVTVGRSATVAGRSSFWRRRTDQGGTYPPRGIGPVHVQDLRPLPNFDEEFESHATTAAGQQESSRCSRRQILQLNRSSGKCRSRSSDRYAWPVRQTRWTSRAGVVRETIACGGRGPFSI